MHSPCRASSAVKASAVFSHEQGDGSPTRYAGTAPALRLLSEAHRDLRRVVGATHDEGTQHSHRMPTVRGAGASIEAIVRRLLHVGPVLLLVGGLIGFAWMGDVGCSSQGKEMRLPVSGAGVTIRRDLPGTSGEHTADWHMEAGGVELVVAGHAGDARGAAPGTILSVRPSSEQVGALRSIETVVFVAGQEYALETERITPVLTLDAPSLRIDQRVLALPIRLSTTLSMQSGREWIDIVTRLETSSDTPISAVALGDRVAWPGAPTFAPRLGFVDEPTTAEAPWMARLGYRYATALVFEDGAANVTFAFERRLPTHQTAIGAPFELAPARAHESRRTLLFVRGGLPQMAALAWQALSRPYGMVHGQLDPPPSWAVVRALHPDGRTVLEAPVDASGQYGLPLPAGTYRLVLECPGGVDEQTVEIDPSSVPVEADLMPPTAGRLRLSATDVSGEALPVRWIVRGVPPTPNPDFGPDERVGGMKNVVYTLHGSGEVELAPGTYRVQATHGPEWSVAEREVSIRQNLGAAVRVELEQEVLTPGWISADLHLHAAPSFDSTVALEDRVIALAAEGVEFAAATDHDQVTDYAPAIARAEMGDHLLSVPGVEITTQNWGHINAYPFPADAGAPQHAGLTAREIFRAARARSPAALIQVNHPQMGSIGYFLRGGLDADRGTFGESGFDWDFDVLELINGFELGDPEVMAATLQDWFALLNRGIHPTAVGNSDSHGLLFQWAGYPRTYVRVASDIPGRVDAAEVVESLRAGRAMLSTGPFVSILVDGWAGPGDLVTVTSEGPIAEISVRAARWLEVQQVEVWVDGKIAARRAVSVQNRVVRLAWQLPLDVQSDAWVVVVVRGQKGLEKVAPGRGATPIAITNPVFIDVDGDGAWKPPVLGGLRFEDPSTLDAARDSQQASEGGE